MRFNERYVVKKGQDDFVPRNKRAQMWNLILMFVLTAAAIFAIGYGPSNQSNNFTPLYSLIVLSGLCFYVFYRRQENLDIVMTTEYQNLLFAQAAGLGASFILILRNDGTIVYANDGARRLFPNAKQAQLLDNLFEEDGIQRTDRDRLLSAIKTGAFERLVFPLTTSEGAGKEYIFTIEPLPRPSGFCVIRGREYLSPRTNAHLMPEMLRATSVDKLEHMLSNTPVVHYTTDAGGRFEYVNPAFEKLLGYEPGQITENKLTLQQSLFKLGGNPVPEDYHLTDYSGDATLQPKRGATVDAFLVQFVIRDVAGKVAGATGSIVPITHK